MEVTIVALRNMPGWKMEQELKRHGAIHVTRNGKPLCIILPPDDKIKERRADYKTDQCKS